MSGFGGRLTATRYGGELTVVSDAQLVENGFQYDDGTFIPYDDGSKVEGP